MEEESSPRENFKRMHPHYFAADELHSSLYEVPESENQ